MKLSEYIDAKLVTQADLCRRIGAHAPDMSRWLKNERPIPEEACAAIERETEGQSPVEENRSDIRWTRIPDPSWPHPQGRPVKEVARA
jgi:DNA-binding transcriptional regulator YdaS (Cro superfamily)